MNDELNQRLAALEAKIDATFVSVEKTRKYFQIVLWVTVAAVALPALGLIFIVPAFLKMYLGAFDGLL